jgi:hypothetical protein
MNLPEVGQSVAANFDALLFLQGQTSNLRFFKAFGLCLCLPLDLFFGGTECTIPFKPQDQRGFF